LPYPSGIVGKACVLGTAVVLVVPHDLSGGYQAAIYLWAAQRRGIARKDT